MSIAVVQNNEICFLSLTMFADEKQTQLSPSHILVFYLQQKSIVVIVI